MAKTHLRLDTRRRLNDGTYPVQIAVGYGTDLYLPTGVYLTAAEWDPATRLAIGRTATRINSALTAILSRAVVRILDLRERGLWPSLTYSQIRAMLMDPTIDTPPDESPKISLGEAFERCMTTKTEHTRRAFVTTFSAVKRFCDPYALPLGMVTRGWLDDFHQSIRGLKVNTQWGYMNRLGTVLNYAEVHDLLDKNPFRGYRVPKEETRMRDLSVDELRRLRDLPLSGKEAEARDLFMLSFYLIGINTVDLAGLTSKSIVGGRLEYRRAKTGKLYSIRIEPEAAVILERYKGKKALISSFDPYVGRTDYRSFIYVQIRHLKQLGIRPDLTPYFARYTWATLAARLDIPKDTISECMGHSHGAAVTGIYIRFSRDKIDEANRRVLDWVRCGKG